MNNKNKIIITLILICSFSFGDILGAVSFTSPTEKHLAVSPMAEMESSLSLRKIKINPNDKTVFHTIIEQEKPGFLGYHGDSLEFMIYQDIIRYVIEVIVELPVREDFHFLAVPFDSGLKIQTKKALGDVFKKDQHPDRALSETTFPLNFSLYDNANRIGLNSIEQYLKNESVKTLGYKKRLVWLFKNLGIKEQEIDKLFKAAQEKLKVSTTGVILQVFDEPDYAFAKGVAYPSYPNGFISSNVTVDEYYLSDDFVPPYPPEVRLMLTNKGTLNPNKPLKIVRYTPGVPQATITAYQNELRTSISKLSYEKNYKLNYQQQLMNAWGM